MKEDYTPYTIKILRKLNFICAFTMERGLNSHSTNKLEIRRFGNPSVFSTYFKTEIAGLNLFKKIISLKYNFSSNGYH